MKQLFVQKFKEAYDNNDLSKCRNELLFLMLAYNSEIKDGLLYDHNLKHLLFNANCILNPIGVNYTSEDYEKHSQILTETIRPFCYACFAFFFSAAISAFMVLISSASFSSHSSRVFA